MFHAKYALPAAILVCFTPPALWSAPPIAPDQFRQFQSVIKPTKDEDKWAQIPWQVSLWEARKQAAKEGKPILLWEMDGHPLGCT